MAVLSGSLLSRCLAMLGTFEEGVDVIPTHDLPLSGAGLTRFGRSPPDHQWNCLIYWPFLTGLPLAVSLGHSYASSSPTHPEPGTHNGVARASFVALLLVLTMEMSLSEFADLQSLSDEGRRARLALPDGCTPGISAMRPAVVSSQRLIVLIDCKSTEPAQQDPKPIRWSQDSPLVD